MEAPAVTGATEDVGDSASPSPNYAPKSDKTQGNGGLLSQAQSLIQRGFSVFPLHGITSTGACTCGNPRCANIGKHPATPHGLKDATHDLETFKNLCTGRDGLNIGLATGEASDVFVIDCDDAQVAEGLLSEHPELARTLRVKTGRGEHFYLRMPPDGIKIPSRAGVLPKLDVRGDGGYVVAPPSLHANGNNYKWVEANAPIVEASEPILRFVQGDRERTPTKALAAPTCGTRPHEAPLSAVSTAGEGTRNATVFAGACQLFREGKMTETEIRSFIVMHTAQEGFSEAEIDRTIRSAKKAVEKEKSDAEGRNPLLICGDSIAPKPIDWLWKGYLAKGKLHVFAGVAGEGKTTLILSVAAAITNGKDFPDGTSCLPSNVVIWSGEDDIADTLVPRLRAAGADMTRVFFIGGIESNGEKRAFDPASDIASLRAQMNGVSFLLVDPLVSAISGDSHRNAETRRSLQPLVDLARDYGVCVLGISHFSKNTQGNRPLDRITGSLAVGAACRVAFACARDTTTGDRFFCRVKSNIGPDGGGWRFTLEQKEIGDGISAQCATWGAALDGAAFEILDAAENGGKPSAEDFLRDNLAQGEMRVTDLRALASDLGLGWRSIETAKKRLGVVARRIGFGASGGWAWFLPASVDEFLSESEAQLAEWGLL